MEVEKLSLKDMISVFLYGKTQEEEDMLFKSFGGKVQGGRGGLRKISWLPRIRGFL